MLPSLLKRPASFFLRERVASGEVGVDIEEEERVGFGEEEGSAQIRTGGMGMSCCWGVVVMNQCPDEEGEAGWSGTEGEGGGGGGAPSRQVLQESLATVSVGWW